MKILTAFVKPEETIINQNTVKPFCKCAGRNEGVEVIAIFCSWYLLNR